LSPSALLLPPRRCPRTSILFPYTTLFRSHWLEIVLRTVDDPVCKGSPADLSPILLPVFLLPVKREPVGILLVHGPCSSGCRGGRSEEHTSELQSRFDLVCRLLLEKKNNIT